MQNAQSKEAEILNINKILKDNILSDQAAHAWRKKRTNLAKELRLKSFKEVKSNYFMANKIWKLLKEKDAE